MNFTLNPALSEDLVFQAQSFAHKAHDSIKQTRKYSGEPYWMHVDSVAQIVSEVSQDKNMIMAAYLHDVLEDVEPLDVTGFFQAHVIANSFGEKTLQLVWELTDHFPKTLRPGWNRAQRKAAETARIAVTSPQSKTIKLADIIDNTAGIVKHDPDFARVYLREVWDVLMVIKEGDAVLWEMARKQISTEAQKLGIILK